MSGRRRGIPWLILLATIIGGAVLQGLTAAPGLGRMPTWAFVLVAVGSVIVLWLQLVATTWAVTAIAARDPLGAVRPLLLVWSGITVVAAAVIAVVSPWALALIAVVALCVLPAVAAGRRPLAGFAAFRRTPWRSIFAVVVSLVGVAVSWVLAVLAGFFLTGAVGGFAMWLWFGMLGAALLLWWARLGSRAALSASASRAAARVADPRAPSTPVG